MEIRIRIVGRKKGIHKKDSKFVILDSLSSISFNNNNNVGKNLQTAVSMLQKILIGTLILYEVFELRGYQVRNSFRFTIQQSQLKV